MDKELGDLYCDDHDFSRRMCRNVSPCSGVALMSRQAHCGGRGVPGQLLPSWAAHHHRPWEASQAGRASTSLAPLHQFE